MSPRLKISSGLVLALAVLLAFVVFQKHPESEGKPLRELSRDQLELRNDLLFVKGESLPFNGTIIERFPSSEIHLTIEICEGKPHGKSCGYFENGQLEVEENFEHGVSHGLRTRWHANGKKKSEAEIANGKIEGIFTRWHENGEKSAAAEMSDGKPHGVTKAWYPNGSLKARVTLRHGEVIERKNFEEKCPSASSYTSR